MRLKFNGIVPVAVPGHPAWQPGDERDVDDQLAAGLLDHADFEQVKDVDKPAADKAAKTANKA